MTLRCLLKLAILSLVWLVPTRPAFPAEKTLRVLFLGDRGHHQPGQRAAELIPVLARRGIDAVYTEKMSDLNPETLAAYDGLVVYANIDEISPPQAEALLNYVAGGKGFIPLHCASYCFRNNDDVVALIGAQFQRHGSGVFRVQPSADGARHPLLQGYRGFESWDETYVHTKHNERDRTVLEYRVEGDQREPWTWIRTHGQGRVFYTAWGHDERTFTNPGFQNLVERGIRWACGGDPSAVPPFADFVATTALPPDLKPFEYVDADVPFYPAGERWGTIRGGKFPMQLPVPPEESVRHVVTPEGFQAELFAAEPLIGGKPLCMNWDAAGRLWIAESIDYPNNLQPPGQGHDQIRILEDANGDGVADRSVVFAAGLSIPTAITFYRGGAIVQDGVQTIYLRDNDGDGQADLRKTLVTGWAMNDTHGGVSNFQYGLDNWFYAMQGYNDSTPVFDDGRQTSQSFRMGFFRFRVVGDGDQTVVKELEFLRSTNNNTWGLGLTEDGLIFGSTANNNPSDFLPIPNRYFESVRGWTASNLNGIADSPKFAPITDKIRQVDQHGGFTAGAGHAIYTARTYPREYWNRTAFVCGPTGHLVAAFVLRPDGAGFRSRNSWNLFASNDEWTAPIMAEVGPDGNVWVLDWYNYIVQHNPTPAGFVTGKGNAYESELRDKQHGRIYRIVYRAANTEQASASPPPALADATTEQLVAALRSDNFLWRRHAQRLLVERQAVDAVPALIALAHDTAVDDAGLNTAVIHALHTLNGLGALDSDNAAARAAVVAGLRHGSAGVRRNALACLPRDQASWTAIAASGIVADPDPTVRLAALLKISELPPAASAAAGPVVAQACRAAANQQDPLLVQALTAAAAAHAKPFLRAIAVGTPTAPVDSASVTSLPPAISELVRRVAEHYGRGRPEQGAAELVVDVADSAVASDAFRQLVAGLSAGWPKDAKIKVDAATEERLLKIVGQAPAGSRAELVSLLARWGSGKLAGFVEQIATALLAEVRNAEAADEARVAAARQLIQFRPAHPELAAQLLDLLSPRLSPTLGAGLVEAVGQSDAAEVGALLAGRAAALTPQLRATALRVLLSRAAWTNELVNAIDAGKLSASDLALEQKQALAAHPDRRIARRAQQVLAREGGLPNPDRQKVIDELSAVAQQAGNAENGLAVFKKTCAKCHTHSGQGTRIGPDLTGMAVHPKHELLIHILDPSRSVEGNFRIYTVVTDEGKILNGLLASETKTAIEIIDVDAQRHVVLRDGIEELAAAAKSLMPEGFEKQHTPDELRDLLEFLTRRGQYLPLPLDKVATIVTTQGMFLAKDAQVERLIFPDWQPRTFKDVPFVLVDPQGDRFPNAVMLRGRNGTIPPTMPASVSLLCNAPAKAIHILGGVSGWGFPATQGTPVTMIVRLRYDDGQIEDHPLRNGVHFADYIRRVDVPESEFAFALRGQQLRYLRVTPQRGEPIQTIELVKGDDEITSPIVMAVTVETR